MIGKRVSPPFKLKQRGFQDVSNGANLKFAENIKKKTFSLTYT